MVGALSTVITTLIVMLGVQKGIEMVSKFLIPGLVILLIGLAIYVMTMPGAIDGVIYYFKPDFSKFSVKTVLAALGQLFYSMSLTTGIMITYGSYMSKKNNMEQSVRQIELFDTGVAILSGLMIVPAVFAFSGGDENAMQSGSGLMFSYDAESIRPKRRVWHGGRRDLFPVGIFCCSHLGYFHDGNHCFHCQG